MLETQLGREVVGTLVPLSGKKMPEASTFVPGSRREDGANPFLYSEVLFRSLGNPGVPKDFRPVI